MHFIGRRIFFTIWVVYITWVVYQIIQKVQVHQYSIVTDAMGIAGFILPFIGLLIIFTALWTDKKSKLSFGLGITIAVLFTFWILIFYLMSKLSFSFM